MTDPDQRPAPRVDWLELFFDLVFVVIVKQITDTLHGEPGPVDFAEAAGLLAVVWLAWLNVTSFVNLAADRPIDRRLPILVSMAGVAMIAVAIPEATRGGALLFVLGLALARTAVWPLWIRFRRGSTRNLVLAAIYGPGIGVLWIATMLVAADARPWVWLALLIAELVFSSPGFGGERFAVPHLIERVGLLVMIVLGESVTELILAVRPNQSPVAWTVTAGAFVLICGIWWHHYQTSAPLAERILRRSSGSVLRDVLVVAHYFLVLGLIGIAAGLGAAIEHADEAHLPFGSVIALGTGIGAYHLANVIIAWRYGVSAADNLVIALPAVLLVALFAVFGGGWPAWLLIALTLAFLAAGRLTGEWAARRSPLIAAAAAG
ncbi:low temperature requirement protein A [uncultured Amnibacterium sp.]|uniref:low temperature requirement protein A n=1 Tax=uncultured Amnibacterium sp. TaxID=1631851 RepID=UPI0035CC232A